MGSIYAALASLGLAVIFPIVFGIWAMWMTLRAVRALESIADSLREPEE